MVSEVGHHHVDGLDIAEPGRLRDLGPGNRHLAVVGRANAAEVGHVVLGPEVAPAHPGVGGDRAGVDHAGHRLEAGHDGEVGVAGGVEGVDHRVDLGGRGQFGHDDADEAGREAVADVVGEVDGVGGVDPDEQADLAG